MEHSPYIDLKRQHLLIREEILAAVGRVIGHGNFILGQEVEQFEAAMAAYCGTKYAVGVNSGTDALFLCLKAYGVGPGDEVMIPARANHSVFNIGGTEARWYYGYRR